MSFRKTAAKARGKEERGFLQRYFRKGKTRRNKRKTTRMVWYLLRGKKKGKRTMRKKTT